MKAKIIAISCISFALTACGGGGGGGGTSTAPTGPSTLQLTAKINGQPVNFTIKAGESKVLGVLTGQEVELDASEPAILLTKTYGTAQANETANSPTQFKATISSTNATIGKLAFNTSKSPALATITLAIQGSSNSFNAVTPVVGDTFTYSEVDKQLGSTQDFAQPLSTHVVTAISANGWTEAYKDPNGATYQTVQLNSNGNRTSYTDQNANPLTSCTTATFTPEEKLLAFPLTPTSAYNGNWKTVCGNNSQDESFTATVKGMVQIATPGGLFNALQIDTRTVVTNSTQTLLPGGTYQQDVTEYFDPVLGRNVRYTGVRTYPAGNPTSGTWLTNVQIDLVSAVKN
ncbi:hypothetical protein [Noviherbaspirillum pedocola]|uniref:Lipoprotein n=1 Tax=Noviherbaspirillum pedocola TaxID=2801341 RepID=A0A934SS55_9BURK|nr:hypothetical protein [Noviherbaspirillum pedocola]MBK4734268.1 hypothetical protein [Noviherbaspirillum pedocola]